MTNLLGATATMGMFEFFLPLVFLTFVAAMPDPLLPFPPPPPEGDPQDYPPMMEGGFHDDLDENATFPFPAVEEVTEAYCQTLLDAPVPLPADQVPWFCICSRCPGNQGPKGDMGERGLQGSPGSAGGRGPTGYRGHPGFVGSHGIKGQKGDEGMKGDRGPEGTMGPKGQRGLKGDKGVRGLEGPPGDQGSKGDEGVCPDSCEAVEGQQGEAGLPGHAGPRGLPGPTGPAGPAGPRGEPGALGNPGEPGVVGPKGETGPEGDCTCQDGTEGPPGERGESGEKGEAGPQGERGEAGERGELGEMGMHGPPGPCMAPVLSSFSAALTTSFPPPNAPVVFSQLQHNVHGHYDPSMGIYTAPVNGTYVFSYHLSVSQRVLKVGLFHNFMPVVKTTSPAQLGATSQQVVLHLARGDGVWLQVKDLGTNGMHTNTEMSSTFSGFLLQPDSCEMAQLRLPIFPIFMSGGTYEWGSLPGPSSPPTTTGPDP